MKHDAGEERLGMLIGGKWAQAASGKTMEVRNPADGSVVAEVPLGGKEDARAAIDIANDAKNKIAKMAAYDRYRFLLKAAQLIEENLESLAHTICIEAGKPIRDSRVEVRRAVVTFTSAAEEAKRIHGEVFQADAYPLPEGNERRLSFSVREPVGVVVGISPFNFPLNLLCHKVAPALAAGNAVIAKPTSETPIVALRLGHLLMEAGCPAGAVNIVTGPGSSVGTELVENPGTDLVTFTGSTATGLGIYQLAARRNKKVILEMGGMDPMIILDDADLARASDAASRACFGLSGQVCTASKRLIVVESISRRFTRLLTDQVKKLKVGDPLREETDVGPVINEGSLHRIHALVLEAVDEGAKIAIGGKRMTDAAHKSGYFYAPTVLSQVTGDMRLMKEEPFGPLGPVQSVADEKEAIEVANSTVYGLQSSIFTQDIGRGLRIAREIRAGGVMVNDPTTLRFDNMPFGGMKMSGLGREGVRYAVQEMSEVKLINVNLA
jgi:succinyl-CoA reductase